MELFNRFNHKALHGVKKLCTMVWVIVQRKSIKQAVYPVSTEVSDGVTPFKERGPLKMCTRLGSDATTRYSWISRLFWGL